MCIYYAARPNVTNYRDVFRCHVSSRSFSWFSCTLFKFLFSFLNSEENSRSEKFKHIHEHRSKAFDAKMQTWEFPKVFLNKNYFSSLPKAVGVLYLRKTILPQIEEPRGKDTYWSLDISRIIPAPLRIEHSFKSGLPEKKWIYVAPSKSWEVSEQWIFQWETSSNRPRT